VLAYAVQAQPAYDMNVVHMVLFYFYSLYNSSRPSGRKKEPDPINLPAPGVKKKDD
jgi:hypothetical protein